ncbi:MAG: fatty acid desaturase family protein, partial [Myxococcota bacterium]
MEMHLHEQSDRPLEAFAAEIEALQKRILADVGEEDARYIRRIVALRGRTELAGRSLLFVGWLPPAWVAGVGLLSLSKILDNMEIGHNVLHGQYDWMKDPRLAADTYEWDWACPAAHWRHSHNFVHHTFTNIVGKDRDVGYGVLRMSDEQRWNPLNVAQPFYALLQMVLFEWAVAMHDVELNLVLTGKRSPRDALEKFVLVARKTTRQSLKDYVTFPLLAGPGAPAVFFGNLSANLIRNVWAFLVIFCGHFPEGVQMYTIAETEDETPAQWYLRQVLGSANIDGPRWFHILSGHLSHQIEHHLFPDMPSSRYAEVAPQVEAICHKYGVPYNRAPFRRQVATFTRRILRGALPLPRRKKTRPAERPVPA